MRITTFLTAIMMWLVAGAAELSLPAVPDTIREPGQRAAYILLHFWDSMDWRDSTLTSDDRFMEQNSANFYSLFRHTDSISASAGVEVMLRGASADMKAYNRVASIAALYLNDPYSPMIDDESYSIVVDRLLADGLLGDADMLRLEDAHRSLMRNRKGSKASDFAIVTREGRQLTLSQATANAPRSLLIFYDPDCHDCAMLEQQLAAAPPKNTGVIMISLFGADDEQWQSHAATMPAEWIVAYTDDDFEDSDLYDIPITPTVYLLDHEMTVLAKNIKDIDSLSHIDPIGQ